MVFVRSLRNNATVFDSPLKNPGNPATSYMILRSHSQSKTGALFLSDRTKTITKRSYKT